MTKAGWFRVPEDRDFDGHKPDLKGYDVDSWTGQKQHPKGSPKWVVGVRAEPSTLDSLADEPAVQRLDSFPVQALNAILGKNWDRDEWNERSEMVP